MNADPVTVRRARRLTVGASAVASIRSDEEIQTLACQLDREADAAVQTGRITLAERLASHAADLRQEVQR